MDKTTNLVDPELLAEINKLHIQTRRLVDESLMGSYRSAFRGSGIEFEEVRHYQPGDDIRAIDWKVTARTGDTFVKSFREERELTVVIAVDVSASTHTGTKIKLREDIIARVGAILTLIALRNNDKVGLVTFSDVVESYHPPRKARSSVWRILHEVLAPREARSVTSNKTDTASVLRFLAQVLKRRSIVFVLSDFLTLDFEQALSALSRKHDLTLIPVMDPSDYELPKTGLLQVVDPESEERQLIDTSDQGVRSAYQRQAQSFFNTRDKLFTKYGVGVLRLQTDCRFVDEIRRYFLTHGTRRKSLSQKKTANLYAPLGAVFHILAFHEHGTGFNDIKPVPGFSIQSEWPSILGGIIALSLGLLVFYLIFGRKKKNDVEISTPTPPDLLALEKIDDLEANLEKDTISLNSFAAQLSYSLRHYMEKKLGLPALEQTNIEILNTFQDNLKKQIPNLSPEKLQTKLQQLESVLVFSEHTAYSGLVGQNAQNEALEASATAKAIVQEIEVMLKRSDTGNSSVIAQSQLAEKG